jgi:hypothetical protein
MFPDEHRDLVNYILTEAIFGLTRDVDVSRYIKRGGRYTYDYAICRTRRCSVFVRPAMFWSKGWPSWPGTSRDKCVLLLLLWPQEGVSALQGSGADFPISQG